MTLPLLLLSHTEEVSIGVLDKYLVICTVFNISILHRTVDKQIMLFQCPELIKHLANEEQDLTLSR